MISFIVNFYNNEREAQRTLYSLSRQNQKNAGDIRYEVIALDNGSTKPLREPDVLSFGPEYRYKYVNTRSKSPAPAINAAVEQASGDIVTIMIDGAHIVSPGIVRAINDAFLLNNNSFVATIALHLGPKVQYESVLDGYSQKVEDALLATVDWHADGYELFSVSGAFADPHGGWFGSQAESNCFAMPKEKYLGLRGYDESFTSRGGGAVNLDFFSRAISSSDLLYILLLGEGTFHQFHGGVATNAPATNHPWNEFEAEYTQIRGKRFEKVERPPVFLGSVPPQALIHLARSASFALPGGSRLGLKKHVRYQAQSFVRTIKRRLWNCG